MLVREHTLGDMALRYEIDDDGSTGLLLYPASMPLPADLGKKRRTDPMVQVKLAGDVYNGCFAPGNTLRGSESSFRLKYSSQEELLEDGGKTIVTALKDSRGCKALHYVRYKEGNRFLTVSCTYENESNAPVTLELLSSFSLSGISPYIPGDASGDIKVHRLQSRWSQEGRLLSQTIEDLQLESSWTLDAVRAERFGQVGSMPVSHYFPFLALEDTRNHVFWGAQLACQSSWQMEIYRLDEAIAISGGLADREMGSWTKTLQPGESLETPLAILSTARTSSLDVFSARLTSYCDEFADSGPESEQSLPIIFNEYCTTWGCPSEENIASILEAIKGKGFEYFVIDCGWYKKDGVNWMVSMGDYIPSDTLFPDGLGKTVDRIHQAGMKAGIWFEIENIGHEADAFGQTGHQLKRDGRPLTTTRRRFWDMNDPWVRDYLHQRVTGTLRKYGFDYMKIDCNDSIGLGCDNPDSLGEGLRLNQQGTVRFIKEVKEAIPGIILENCASGGHRLEPGYMSLTSMASFSDAHECVEIPIIAANVHRAILPRQSQIWAVIRETDSLKRIAYSVASTFLGRMCISGDVINLSPEQWAVIDEGMAFYRAVSPVIKKGQTYHLSPQIERMRHPEGWQGIVRIGENGEAYALVHTFGGSFPDVIRLALPEGCPSNVVSVYSDITVEANVKDGVLSLSPGDNFRAVAVRLA